MNGYSRLLGGNVTFLIVFLVYIIIPELSSLVGHPGDAMCAAGTESRQHSNSTDRNIVGPSTGTLPTHTWLPRDLVLINWIRLPSAWRMHTTSNGRTHLFSPAFRFRMA